MDNSINLELAHNFSGDENIFDAKTSPGSNDAEWNGSEMKIQDHLIATNANVVPEPLGVSKLPLVVNDDKARRYERFLALHENMDPDAVYTAQDLARDIDEVMSREASNAVMLREIGKLVRQALGDK